MLKQLLEMMQDYNTELKKTQEVFRNSLKVMKNSQESTKNNQETMKTELKTEVKVDQSQLESIKNEVKNVKRIENEAEDKHEELKMEMRNMKENFVQFSTSGVVSDDGSGTSFSKIQTPTFDEITFGGKTEEEVTILRKQKIECGRHIQDQEEELEELAGLESMRKEAKQKAQMRDGDLEDVRCSAQNNVTALEAPLNHTDEERTLLLWENHELGRRLSGAVEPERDDRVDDEVLLQGLERDLKMMKTSLRDTQTQLDRKKAKTPSKAALRQLRNQLENMKCFSTLTVKANLDLKGELLGT